MALRAGPILIAILLVVPLCAALPGAPAPGRVVILTHDPVGLPILGGDVDAGFVVIDAAHVASLPMQLRQTLIQDDVPAHADGVPDDALWPSQWAPQALDMAAAWDLEPGSTGVKVALIDSGLDAAHPDFAGVPIENGTDYVQHDATPQDENGHGTHVAGILAAARGNGIGVAGLARVTLVPIRALDDMGNGKCLDIALAVLEAMSRGASIINLSLECGSDYAPLHLAIQAAARQGVLVVAAAGNHALTGLCPVYPAQYPEVLAVAALDDATQVADYSCRASNVELAAPGTRILSTWKDGYQELSGTSMATPHVAGIAALLKSRFPSMDGAAIRARLDATAADLGAPGRDDESGYGRIDPVRALAS